MIGLKSKKQITKKSSNTDKSVGKGSAQIASERLYALNKTEYPRVRSELVGRMSAVPNGKVSSRYDSEFEFIRDLSDEFMSHKDSQDVSDLVPYIKYDDIENSKTILPIKEVDTASTIDRSGGFAVEDTLDENEGDDDDVQEIEML